MKLVERDWILRDNFEDGDLPDAANGLVGRVDALRSGYVRTGLRPSAGKGLAINACIRLRASI